MRNKRTQSKKPKKKELGFDPSEWEIDVHIGKSFLYNPTNARSYVGVRIKHLPSGRMKEAGRKGCFTKAQANDLATELFQQLLASIRPALKGRGYTFSKPGGPGCRQKNRQPRTLQSFSSARFTGLG